MRTTIDIVHISDTNGTSPSHTMDKKQSLFSHVDKKSEQMRNIVHSFKVGFALVLVSLVYIFDPLYEQVGENAMWAIMTIEVIFEFHAGATISKGLLRAFGTILGGGLGCLATFLANYLAKNGNAIVIAIIIFIFGAMATYCRFIPSINKRYDYGVTVFILTFNLIALSTLRIHEVMELAHRRLSAVGIGFSVCIFCSLIIFPMWASDELHYLTSSKFNELACCIEECIEAYFSVPDQKESCPIIHISSCNSVLHSKSSDESLVNFARWEPWHGRLSFCNPWEKHQQIAEMLRELSSTIMSLQRCLKSPLQPSSTLREAVKEPCNNVGLSLGLTMRELGESIIKKKQSKTEIVTVTELQSIKANLLSTAKVQATEYVEYLAIANFLFLLMEIVKKVEALSKEVETLGRMARFQSK